MDNTQTSNSRLTFEGSYDDAFALVDQLRAARLSVTWTPPDQERSGMVQDIIVGLVVSGTVESVRSTVSHFVERHRAKVHLEQPDRKEDSTPQTRPPESES